METAFYCNNYRHFTFIISKSLKFNYLRDISAELLVVNNIIL